MATIEIQFTFMCSLLAVKLAAINLLQVTGADEHELLLSLLMSYRLLKYRIL